MCVCIWSMLKCSFENGSCANLQNAKIMVMNDAYDGNHVVHTFDKFANIIRIWIDKCIFGIKYYISMVLYATRYVGGQQWQYLKWMSYAIFFHANMSLALMANEVMYSQKVSHQTRLARLLMGHNGFVRIFFANAWRIYMILCLS